MFSQIPLAPLAGSVAANMLALLCVMAFVAMARRVYPGFRLWVFSLGLLGLGALLVALFWPGNRVLSAGVASSLGMIAAMTSQLGVRRFRGFSGLTPLDWGLGLLGLAITWGMFLAGAPDALRVALWSFTMGLLILRSAVTMATRVRSGLRPAYYVYSAVQGLMFCVLTARGVLLLLDDSWPIDDAGLSQVASVVFFFGGGLTIMLWCFAAIVVTGQRQEMELLDAQSVLRSQADTDFLTGLANRRRFFESARDAIERRARGAAQSVLILDIDHFKEINDTFGHEAGDLVLRDLAHSLLRNLPNGALLGRIGGEEFAMLVPLPQDRALRWADSVRLEAAELNYQRTLGGKPVTVSLGIAEVVGGEDSTVTLNQAIHRADMALYDAKRLGRNRAIAAQENLDEDEGRAEGSSSPGATTRSRRGQV